MKTTLKSHRCNHPGHCQWSELLLSEIHLLECCLGRKPMKHKWDVGEIGKIWSESHWSIRKLLLWAPNSSLIVCLSQNSIVLHWRCTCMHQLYKRTIVRTNNKAHLIHNKSLVALASLDLKSHIILSWREVQIKLRFWTHEGSFPEGAPHLHLRGDDCDDGSAIIIDLLRWQRSASRHHLRRKVHNNVPIIIRAGINYTLRASDFDFGAMFNRWAVSLDPLLSQVHAAFQTTFQPTLYRLDTLSPRTIASDQRKFALKCRGHL